VVYFAMNDPFLKFVVENEFFLFFPYSFRVRKQVVNIPSYIVRLDSQKHIDFSLKSPYGGGRAGESVIILYLW